MNIKKLIACVLTLCMTASIASFPAMADDATYPTRVKVFTMGDSFTQGVIEPNAYRYYIYENLIKDGAVFEFIGPSTSGDFRVTDKYERHGGVGGAVIGDVKDYKWDGSKWVATSHIDYPDTNHTIGGTVNSLHYRLFAGSDGTNDYTKTQYGSYVKNADIVTVFIGLNDYYDGSAGGRSHNLADVLNRYRVIVDRIFEINPDVSLYLTDLPVVGSLRGWTDPNDKNGVYAYNKGILETLVPEYQAKGKNIHGISLNQEAYKWDDATDHPDDDGHPNPKGNRKIGTQIYLGIKDEVLERNKVLTDVVYNPVRVSSLTLNKTSAAMKTGEDLTLEWELLPADAEIISVLFSSSNEQVATVDKYGRVHAVGAGSATITATALDNSEIKVTCELTVTGEIYKKISDGTNFITEASNLLSSASDWTGNTAQINAASGIFKGSWETIGIEGKKSYDLGANFAMSVGIAMMGCEKHSVNNTNEISNFYASMTVGDFELRATAGSKLLLVYYKGNEVLRHVFKAPVTRENDDRYTVAKYGDTLYLYRNNELLEQAAIDESATLSGNVILYSKGWNPNNFRDVVLKTGVQAPDGTAMPGRITGVTVKDHTWTPTGNDPNKAHDISRLVDGDINTDWQGNLNWGGNISHTFLLELPAEKYVTGMIQHWGSNSGFAKPTNNTKTYFSTDGENWTLMGEYYDPDFVTDGNSTWGATRLVLNYDLDTPTKAKYIKIVSDENGGARALGAYEFEVRGYDSDPVIVDYTVNCVDADNGNTVFNTYTEQAFVGFNTTVTPKQIDGYSLISEPITMRFGTEPIVLTFAYNNLTGEDADYTAVDAALAKVPDEMMLAACTAKSAQAVRDAVSAVVRGLKSSAQSRVNSFAKAILAAIDGLEQKETIDASQVKLYGHTGSEIYTSGTVVIDNVTYYKEKLTDGVTTIANNSRDYVYFDSYNGTTPDRKGTVVVDLKEVKTVTSLKLYGGGATWGADAPLEYYVYLAGEDGKFGDSVYHFGPLEKNTQTPYQRTDEIALPAAASARYVKVAITQALHRMALTELEIYTHPDLNEPATLTVSYVNKRGEKIAEDKVVSDLLSGKTVNETAISVDGYEPEEPTTAQIVLKKGENTFTFVYRENSGFKYAIETAADGVTLTVPASAAAYETVTFTTDKAAAVSITASDGTNLLPTVNGNTYTFTMPEMKVTVTAAPADAAIDAAPSALPSRTAGWEPWFGDKTSVGGQFYTNDGVAETMFFLQSSASGKAFFYDLGAEYLLSEVAVDTVGSGFGFTAAASMDGETYYDISADALQVTANGTTSIKAYGKARYLRLTIDTQTTGYLCEVHIYGVPTAEKTYTVNISSAEGCTAVKAERTALAEGDRLVITLTGFDEAWFKDAYLLTEGGQKYLLSKMDRRNYTYGRSTMRDTDAQTGQVRFTAEMPADRVTGVEINYYQNLVTTEPTDTNCYVTGRHAKVGEMLWLGASLEFEFTGTSIGLDVTAVSDSSCLYVQIDGENDPAKYTFDRDSHRIIVKDHTLSAGKHTVRIIRGSEKWTGAITINSLITDKDAVLTENYKPNYKLKIELLGDSITCGAVNRFTMSYGFRTGEFLDAEVNFVSASGGGMYRDSGKGTDNIIPDFYDNIKPIPDTTYPAGTYTHDFYPDVIAINLATNDANSYSADGFREGYVNAYVAFLEKALAKNTHPDGTLPKFVLMGGQMEGDWARKQGRSMEVLIREAAEQFKAAHPEVTLEVLYFDYRIDKPEYNLSDGHPGILTHARDALRLTETIKGMFPELYPTSAQTPAANIRLGGDSVKAGLRFKTDFAKDSMFLNMYGEGLYCYTDDATVQFGTLLIPKELLGSYANVAEMFLAEMSLSESERQVLNVAAKNIYRQTDGTVSFTGVLTDIPKARYNTEVCAVGYVRYRSSADQEWHYEFSDQKIQSYAGVAKLARENEYSDEKIKGNAALEAIAKQLDEIIGGTSIPTGPELPGETGDDGQGGWIDNGKWY